MTRRPGVALAPTSRSNTLCVVLDSRPLPTVPVTHAYARALPTNHRSDDSGLVVEDLFEVDH